MRKVPFKQVGIDPQLHAKLTELSDDLGFSLTKLVGVMLENKLDEMKEKDDYAIRVEKQPDGTIKYKLL